MRIGKFFKSLKGVSEYKPSGLTDHVLKLPRPRTTNKVKNFTNKVKDEIEFVAPNIKGELSDMKKYYSKKPTTLLNQTLIQGPANITSAAATPAKKIRNTAIFYGATAAAVTAKKAPKILSKVNNKSRLALEGSSVADLGASTIKPVGSFFKHKNIKRLAYELDYGVTPKLQQILVAPGAS